MIIHPPRITTIGDDLRISSRIEVQGSGRRSADNLWFRFPASSQPSGESDPFVVALLLLAMQNEEDIEVHGSLSRRLYEGLERYQRVFRDWFPDRFKVIEIRASSLRDDAISSANGRAAAFSGGVDSFYTFLTLREKLTHTVFMAGFDMPVSNPSPSG